MSGTSSRKPSARVIGLYFLIILIIVVGVAVYIIKEYDTDVVIDALASVNPFFIMCGIFMLFLQLYSEAGSFKVLFSLLGKKVSVSNAAGYAGTDLFYSSISPAQIAGVPAAGYTMHRDGLEVSNSCSVIIIYSLCNRVAVVLIAIASGLIFPEILKNDSSFFKVLFIFGMSANALLISGILVSVFAPGFTRKLFPGIVLTLSKIKFLRIKPDAVVKASKTADDYINASAVMRKSPCTVAVVLIICLFKRLVNFAIAYFVYLSFGLSGVSIIYIIAVQSILTVSAETVPVPGSEGVYESVFIMLYSSIFGAEEYIPALIVTRFLSFFSLMALGGCYTFMHSYKKNKWSCRS